MGNSGHRWFPVRRRVRVIVRNGQIVAQGGQGAPDDPTRLYTSFRARLGVNTSGGLVCVANGTGSGASDEVLLLVDSTGAQSMIAREDGTGALIGPARFASFNSASITDASLVTFEFDDGPGAMFCVRADTTGLLSIDVQDTVTIPTGQAGGAVDAIQDITATTTSSHPTERPGQRSAT